ncbi:MAG: PAS domain S-box protein [Deltaproteobacteria bacterium]|nr:PAS domain S-box protein [Deltaproteobacteria bacterium]
MEFIRKNEDVLIFLSILFISSLSAFYSYLLFHTFAELFSIIVGVIIFVLTFNLRDKTDQGYLTFLGISYLFTSLLDLVHTLAYKGMNIFIGFDANLPTQLWISARYLESLSFFAALFFVNKKVNVYSLIFVYFTAVTMILLSIFTFKNFPDCYIEGKGLTAFKIYSEYVICVILTVSLFFLRKKKNAFPKITLKYLQLALLTTIFAELAFTQYVGVYDGFNFAGHILKVVSFFFIYKAVVKEMLSDPFDLLWIKLKKNEESLKKAYLELTTYIEVLDLVFVVIDKNFKVSQINQKGAEKLGYTKEELMGKDWFETLIPKEERDAIRGVFESVISGQIEISGYFENRIVRKDGTERIFAWHNTVLRDLDGKPIATVSAGEDITDKKVYDENREKLVKQLQKALESIKTLRGLIPICAWCKKIRTDEGYWMALETYLKEQTEADFTHAMCPECYQKAKKEMENL